MGTTEFVVDKDKLQVRSTRVFSAPRAKVWHAMTDKEMIPKWWGPAIYSTTVDKLDVRVGGEWRFLQKGADGAEFAFHGVFKEVDEPNKVVQTFVFEPMPASELTDTMALEDVEGGTKFTATSQYSNLADLEGMVASGMEGGNRESHERLATLVE